MKKFIITAALCFGFLLSTTAFAKSVEFTIDDNTLYVSDGAITAVELETAPYEKDGRTMVPVRAITESFGADVSWDETTETVGIKSGDLEIKLTLGSDKAYINGEEYPLDAPATEINGRTMVPVRFISEALKYDVTYTDELRTIYITDEKTVLSVGDVEYNKDDVDVFLSTFAYADNYDKLYETVIENLKQFAVFANETKALSADSSLHYNQWIMQVKETADELHASMLITPYVKLLKLYGDAVVYTTALSGQITDEQAEEKYHNDYISVKHILLMTIDQKTGEALSDKEKRAVRSRMNDILNQAKGNSDFDKLMNEHSEDTGLIANPDGYVFTKGMMVKEFEDAAYALKTGEISQIIETSYGYHIIKKQVLPELDEQTKATVVSQLFNDLIFEKYNELCKNYEITVNITEQDLIGLLINY